MMTKFLFGPVAAALLVVASVAHAQAGIVPGSGCPGGNSAPIVKGGAPIAGRTLTLEIPRNFSCTGATAFLIGPPLAVLVPQPLSCPPGPCMLACNAVWAPPGPTVQFTLPATSAGLTLCVQIACFDGTCYELSMARTIDIR